MSKRFTAERLAELRRVAEAATPGPWAFPHQKDPYGCYLLPLSENNASYIAVFDPTTCLAMLDEIDRLRRERDNWKRVAEQKTDALCDVAEERARLRTEREVLAEAVRAMKYFFDSDYSDPEESATLNWAYAHQKWLEALLLLDGEKGGGGA